MYREQFVGAGYSHCPCFGYIKVTAAIMVFRWATIPGIDSAGPPQRACEGGRVYDSAGAGGGHWVGIPIVFFTMELLVRGDIRVNAGAPEKIACDDGLLSEVVPQLELKSGVCRAEATNEVVFKGLYSTFGCIYSVIVGFNQLNCSSFVVHEGPDGGCRLILCHVKMRSVTPFCQHVVCLFERCEDIVVAGG